MYRFLLSPRWIGFALLAMLAAAVMVGLGLWQLHRFHERSAVNARINAAGKAAPVPLSQVLAAPPAGSGGSVGAPPSPGTAWARVTAAGRYDPAHEVLAWGRTVSGSVGFEVFTPLLLDNGSAVLVDRGWIPPAASGPMARPDVPPAPAGQVVVTGRVHEPESRANTPQRTNGELEVRRVAPQKIAPALPYPLYGGYVIMDAQDPPADSAFVPIPSEHQNAMMNAGYTVQWWIFAALALAGYGYAAVREARHRQAVDHGLTDLIGPPATA